MEKISNHILIRLVFALQPVAFGGWLPRIPEIQEKLSLDPKGLALTLLGLPTGILLTLLFGGKLVGLLGGRATIFMASSFSWASSRYQFGLVLRGCCF